MSGCCFNEDAPDVYAEKWFSARRQYKCCECRALIDIGDDYQRITMLYDGRWSRYRTCEKCADLRESLEEIDCPYIEGLAECYKENVIPGTIKPGSHAAKLLPDYYLIEEVVK